jgi:hypothetical protein
MQIIGERLRKKNGRREDISNFHKLNIVASYIFFILLLVVVYWGKIVN